MSNGIGVMIETAVSILLVITIGYCFMLEKRLRRLKADESILKATISELITATEIAERAIAGLKLAVRDCDQNLGERLRTAERFSADIARQLSAGEAVLSRLGRIVAAAKPDAGEAAEPEPEPAAAVPDAQAIVRAAEAFAARARLRVTGTAA